MCEHRDLTLKKKYYICKGRPTKQIHHEILKNKLGDFSQYSYIGRYNQDNQKDDYMLSFEKNGIVYPEITNKCACDHWIRVNCYIWHDITKEIYTLGNCCIKFFKIKKHCTTCGIEHQRFKYNICNKCQILEKLNNRQKQKKLKDLEKHGKKKIMSGKYKNVYTIDELYNNDREYFDTIISEDIKSSVDANLYFICSLYSKMKNQI